MTSPPNAASQSANAATLTPRPLRIAVVAPGASRAAIVNNTPFETDGEDNLETLRIVADAYRLTRAA